MVASEHRAGLPQQARPGERPGDGGGRFRVSPEHRVEWEDTDPRHVSIAELHQAAEVRTPAPFGEDRLTPADPRAKRGDQAGVGGKLLGEAVGEAATDDHQVGPRGQVAVGERREFDQLSPE